MTPLEFALRWPHPPCPTPEKKRFRSAAAARRWHTRELTMPTGQKDHLRPYQCPCRAWHLTHQTADEAAAIYARILARSRPA